MIDNESIISYKHYWCEYFINKLYKEGKISEEQCQKLEKAVQKRLIESI